MPPSATWLTKLKVQLKLAIARLRMVQQRDEQLGKTNRRAMAHLLEIGKVDSATIRVEGIIRADMTSELHELLELYCELLLARAGLLEGAPGSGCDAGLEEAVKSIVYAAPKTEIKELNTVRGLLAERFGKEFVLAAMENGDGKVSPKVVRKLGVEPPREELVRGYLEEIAKAYGVDWPRRRPATPPPPPEPDGDIGLSRGDGNDLDIDSKDKQEQGGYSEEGNKYRQDESSNKVRLDGPKSPLTVTPPRMTTDNVHPKVMMGDVELKPRGEPEGAVPDIGDLERRFAALKKR